jgi:hypothetical protein
MAVAHELAGRPSPGTVAVPPARQPALLRAAIILSGTTLNR